MSGWGNRDLSGLRFSLDSHGFLLLPRSAEHPDGVYYDFQPNLFSTLKYKKRLEGDTFKEGAPSDRRSGNQFFFEKNDVYSWWHTNRGDGPLPSYRINDYGAGFDPVLYKNGKPLFSPGAMAGFFTQEINGYRYYLVAKMGQLGNELRDLYLSVYDHEYVEGNKTKNIQLISSIKIWPQDETYRYISTWPVRFSSAGTSFAFISLGSSKIDSYFNQILDTVYLVQGSCSYTGGFSINSVDAFISEETVAREESFSSIQNYDPVVRQTMATNFNRNYEQTITRTLSNSDLPIALNYRSNNLEIQYYNFDGYSNNSSFTVSGSQSRVYNEDDEFLGYIKSGSMSSPPISYSVRDLKGEPVQINETRLSSDNDPIIYRTEHYHWIDALTGNKVTSLETIEIGSSSSESYNYYDDGFGVSISLVEGYYSSYNSSRTGFFQLEGEFLGLNEQDSYEISNDPLESSFTVVDGDHQNVWLIKGLKRSDPIQGLIRHENRANTIYFLPWNYHRSIYRGYLALYNDGSNTTYSEHGGYDTSFDVSFVHNNSYQQSVISPVFELFYGNYGGQFSISYVYDERINQWCASAQGYFAVRTAPETRYFIFSQTYSSLGPIGGLIPSLDDNGLIMKDESGQIIHEDAQWGAVWKTNEEFVLDYSKISYCNIISESFLTHYVYRFTIHQIGLF